MADMHRDTRITIRITTREREKIDECAAVMGVSSGEFLRRCLQVMLSVMGDQESTRALHRIIDEAAGVIKMGAGLAPVPPTVGRITGTHLPEPVVPRSRRRKGGK